MGQIVFGVGARGYVPAGFRRHPGFPAFAQAQQSFPDDHVIVAGVRAGRVGLGISSAELYQILGDPKQSRRSSNGTAVYDYDAWEIVTDDNKVIDITVMLPAFRTASGLNVGSSDLKIQASMGQPACLLAWSPDVSNYMLIYPGIFFDIRGGVVRAIRLSTLNPRLMRSGKAHC